MPLLILGIIVLIGLLIYAIFSYISSGKEIEAPVVIHKKDDNAGDESNKALYFPTENIDTEKHKRNIH